MHNTYSALLVGLAIHYACRRVQDSLVQATYWHDPLHENTYRLKSTFLSDINNEVYVNEGYAENLNKLKK